MRVVIDATVFPESHPRKLSVLCDHGIERRHRLQVDDPDSPHFVAWLDGLAEWQRVDWQTALELGSRDDGLEPSLVEIRIVVAESSSWGEEHPALTLEDALHLLGEKFQIVLEGDAEDRDFLLAMSNEQQQRFLLDREAQKALDVVLGGGVDSMIKRARRDCEQRDSTYGRRWYLFDSDALRPREPSSKSKELRNACGTHIPYLQLSRRAIENYLPLDTLRNWAYSKRRAQRHRIAKFEAFLRLKDQKDDFNIQHYFNMKHGFKKKRDKRAEAEDYTTVPQADRDALREGFGEDIGRLFQGGSIERRHLERDGGWQDVNPNVARLVALMR